MVKAHLWPRSLYELPPNGEAPTKIFSNQDGYRPKTNRIGLYDPEILCGPCDKFIGSYDQTAADVLKQWPARRDLWRGNDGFILKDYKRQRVGYLIANPPTDRLKAFFASVIWRFSISRIQEAPLTLDDRENQILKEIVERGQDNSAQIGVFARRYHQRERWQGGLFVSVANELHGRRNIRWSAYGWEFNLLFLGDQPLPESLEGIKLPDNGDWLIPFQEFEQSSTFNVMRDMAGRHPNPWPHLARRTKQ